MPRFPIAELPAAPDLSFERALWDAGCTRPAGLDEAGRGAWAGPVYAGAVILPPEPELVRCLHGVRDSKQMTPRQREHWAVEIIAAAAAWGIGSASAAEIDALGILPATRLAMQRALDACALPPQHLLIDAVRLKAVDLPQTPLIKGDRRSLSIAAASVLAKTARDAWMVALDQELPAYGFAAHKGYGTRRHQQALAQSGACPEHRMSYAPLRALRIQAEAED